MNQKFKNLLASMAQFGSKLGLMESETEKSIKAAHELGMDTPPFLFEEPQTLPEREIDFIINSSTARDSEKKASIESYTMAGYMLNKKELFAIVCDTALLSEIIRSETNKNKFLKTYQESLKSLANEALYWSDKKDMPDLELLILSCAAPGVDKFLENKQKGYRFLNNFLIFIPEIYECSLEDFHARKKMLKDTIDIVSQVESEDKSHKVRRNESECRDLKYKIASVLQGHLKLYDQISNQTPEQLSHFVKTAQKLNEENALSQKIKNNNPYKLGRTAEIEKLPIEAQNLVKSITQMLQQTDFPVHNTMKASGVDINIEHRLTLENTVKKDIPQILQQYLSLSSQDKEKFLNENGQPVEQLLIQSLQSIQKNIHTIINDYLEQQGQQKLKALQVSHQYLTSKKV